MKRSELRELIREELKKDNKLDGVTKFEFINSIKSNISSFKSTLKAINDKSIEIYAEQLFDSNDEKAVKAYYKTFENSFEIIKQLEKIIKRR